MNILSWSVVYGISGSQSLELVFFDVGQGDSIFVETPMGYQVLIDGGPSARVLEKLGEEMSFWDRSLDLIVLTHPEHDHMAGLIEVLKRYSVDNVLWTGILRDSGEYDEWLRLISDLKVKIARSGQKVIVPDAFFEILHPFENLQGETVKNTNNSSVVSRLAFHDNCFIFTGDIYSSVEKEILQEESDLDCEVLKIAHHGSKTSTSKELLETVTPQAAIISSGRDNSYGHPHEEVLEILAEYDIRVLRTDRLGDVRIISDGNNITITN